MYQLRIFHIHISIQIYIHSNDVEYVYFNQTRKAAAFIHSLIINFIFYTIVGIWKNETWEYSIPYSNGQIELSQQLLL